MNYFTLPLFTYFRSTFTIALAVHFLSACGGGGGNVPCQGTLQGLNDSCGQNSISISGTIQISENSFIDSDVNDSSNPYQSNSSFALAQTLSNPATLGGHVNVALQGNSTGQTYISGDTSDFYEVALRENQKIFLSIADNRDADQQNDSNPNDLNLYLYNLSHTEVDNSLGSGFTESVTAITDGIYFVEVRVASGSANYLLSISSTINSGLTNPTALQHFKSDRLSTYDNFKPGEILVRYKDTVAPQNHQSVSALSLHSLGLKDITPGRRQQRKLKLQLNPGITPQLSKNSRLNTDETKLLKTKTIEAIKALRRRPDVEYAEPNYIYTINAVPNDNYYSLQWHHPIINLPAAWDITTGNEDIIVAVIDTGILSSHPDISPNLMAGYDFISDATISQDGDGIDNNPDDPGDRENSEVNSSFHGTHVAGIVAAVGNNTIGITGVAWQTTIMPLRALGVGGGLVDDLAQAILYAAKLENDSGTTPLKRADIINLSLGGPDQSSVVSNALNLARAAGVTIVAGSGNSGSNDLFFPASNEGVISVGAVDMQKNVTSYSNFGSTVDVVAPGGDLARDRDGDSNLDGVLSLLGEHKNNVISNTYGHYEGTSMAAPHVAGVIALMLSVKQLTPNQIDNLLSAGDLTDDLGDTGRDDQYGYGLINAFKAVIAAQGQNINDQTPHLQIFPSTIDMGSTNSTSFFYVVNSGGGTLAISSVLTNPNDTWLTVAAPNDSDLGEYALIVDRNELEENLYTSSITIAASNGDIKTITVQMQVSNSQVPTNTGTHYILLIDPKISEQEAVTQLAATAVNGQYHFSFDNVTPGDYTLIAGSDRDSDGFICGSGSLESCGKYPTYSRPELVTITKSTDNLNFSTNYKDTLATSSLSSQQNNRSFHLGSAFPVQSVSSDKLTH